MLGVYKTFAEEYMALPVFAGRKTDAEKFAGAQHTYSIEAMMQDGKALQAGTSHNLGQNFARTFQLQYQTADNRMEFCWNTSWGVSTRLVGALIMGHSDDNGLVVPPRLAPHAGRDRSHLEEPRRSSRPFASTPSRWSRTSADVDFSVICDLREQFTPGWKYAEWEVRGVPVRIEAGPKDSRKNQVVLVRRDNRAKQFVPREGVADALAQTLRDDAEGPFREGPRRFATRRRSPSMTTGPSAPTWTRTCGFATAHWCGDAACEAKVKEETKATIRTVPEGDFLREEGRCVVCGAPSHRV